MCIHTIRYRQNTYEVEQEKYILSGAGGIYMRRIRSNTYE
jgi:hypothetical protein